jgi:hypothetical protein
MLTPVFLRKYIIYFQRLDDDLIGNLVEWILLGKWSEYDGEMDNSKCASF